MNPNNRRRFDPWFGRSKIRNALTVVFLIIFLTGMLAGPIIFPLGEVQPIGNHTVFRFPEPKVKVGVYLTPFEALVFDNSVYLMIAAAIGVTVINGLNKRFKAD